MRSITLWIFIRCFLFNSFVRELWNIESGYTLAPHYRNNAFRAFQTTYVHILVSRFIFVRKLLVEGLLLVVGFNEETAVNGIPLSQELLLHTLKRALLTHTLVHEGRLSLGKIVGDVLGGFGIITDKVLKVIGVLRLELSKRIRSIRIQKRTS